MDDDRDILEIIERDGEYGSAHGPTLYPAIGRVAVESGLQDELLRDVLVDIVGNNIWYMFEGISTDSLLQACRAAVGHHDPGGKRFAPEHLAPFTAALDGLARLTDHRNWVVHGIWSRWAIDEEHVIPRPWGNSGDEEVLICCRSRSRKRLCERAMTVGDVYRLADEIAAARQALVVEYRNMTGGSEYDVLAFW